MVTIIALSNLVTNIAVLTCKKTLKYSIPIVVLILAAVVYYTQKSKYKILDLIEPKLENVD